jgi:hypothetical protein
MKTLVGKGHPKLSAPIRQAALARALRRLRLGLAQPGAGECLDGGRDLWIAINENKGEPAFVGEPCCLPSIGGLLGREMSEGSS